ncbi:hypothetical protein AMATHDRAFT_134061 [Amanita thiersii Skay4041]|uniref:NAD(P)-binding domain-containing protein n=1 Tax=Amanita thiersii Skay4041 TaxID=703135 RepID=A0A2A9P0T0_9AGAR|nr:hypothetical protein AMATHDRAFT_134061 [Amanita thiersii Skay4041]
MRLIVFGATGPTGICLVRKCLTALPSATIVLYVRSPGKLPHDIAVNPAVIVIEGLLDNVDAMSNAIKNANIVLSALGPTGPIYPSNTPLAGAYTRIIDLMHQHNIRRLICLGATSIKDSNDKHSVTFSLLINGVAIFAKNAYNDMVAIGDTIRSMGGDLDWTIARVPLLTNSKTSDIVAGYVGDGKTGAFLSREGFATFVLGEIEGKEWIQKAPLVSST